MIFIVFTLILRFLKMFDLDEIKYVQHKNSTNTFYLINFIYIYNFFYIKSIQLTSIKVKLKTTD